ncbi:HAD family hydrolase [Sphingomonas ginsenosidivorax]|uniref:HAD family hydrolase n=1 Tax=Sphingomonas ginsenosidivorax TaxID=862135 RepID=A0A5C6U9T7_9SPHN|nr:HAD family hydrolase [Sphingomonas ginsenosidivorax]TXC69649.1 HAD family hydrolase [Sphingomonas ginsenosidivorax]
MTDTILARDLSTALDAWPGLRVLSLDCFDTLLWRDTHAPQDVFGALGAPNAHQRVWAEQRARGTATLRHHRNEVSIAEIYAELAPNATADARAAMVAHELATEARHCFGFAPVIALMQTARARGLMVIVISDTYLDREQLGALIAHAAGAPVRALIDRIYCSSDYGVSKGEGLIGKVAAQLGVRRDAILHIGDNRAADLVAGQKAGVHALHLKQFGTTTEQRLRLEAATSAMIHPGTAIGEAADVPAAQPHRAAIAVAEPGIDDPAERLGYTTIGPVLRGFADWIAREAATLRTTCTGRVHVLFLMRDGHLPRLVQDAVAPDGISHAIEISRFTATAATFETEDDVTRYLEGEAGSSADAILTQLLFVPAEIAVMKRGLPAQGAHAALVKAIRAPHRMARILTRSRAFAERLCGYLRATVAPDASDTLMLVDLGYNGSVQNQVEPVLRRALGVAVAGRYLLLREQDMPGLDKRGFIGARHYDANTLEALCGNVAVLEQLCTAAQGSVVDYTADGHSVRAANAIKGAQSETRDAVQRGAIRYAREAVTPIVRASPATDIDVQRRAAVSVLARLMFLPMPDELAVLDQFQHDVNLGGGEVVPLFDRAIAQRGLRQRGLFYMRGSERMYLPAELHGEGLAVKLTLLAHKRFGLALKYADFIDRTITLPVLIADGRTVDTATITATPTHDGYFVAPIPISDCRYAIGLQFGQLYEWLQVESAVFMPVDRFLSDRQRAGAEEVAAVPTLEGMEQAGPHLFRCEDRAAFMMIPPPPRADARAMMLAVVFRPIVARDAVDTPPAGSARAIMEVAR